jgi:hypothetical protein
LGRNTKRWAVAHFFFDESISIIDQKFSRALGTSLARCAGSGVCCFTRWSRRPSPDWATN